MIEPGVILFHTTASVMRAEKVLIGLGLSLKLIPPPRELSSDCVIAIQFEWADKEKIEHALAKAAIELDSIHPLPH